MVSEQETRSAPSPKIRLAWWFGIYFAAQLPLITYFDAFYLFPIGMPFPFSAGKAASPFVIFVPYAVYIVHLIATLMVPSKALVRVMLAILIVIVVLNLVGCESMLEGLHHIN